MTHYPDFLFLDAPVHEIYNSKGMNKNYDVIIVGGGPAGIFAALELSRNNLSSLLIEKGKDLDLRRCPMREAGRQCVSCSPCSVTCGLGGAGACVLAAMTRSWPSGTVCFC